VTCYNLTFRFDPADLLAQYADGATPQTMSEMHRALALRIEDDWHRKRQDRAPASRGIPACPRLTRAGDPGLDVAIAEVFGL